MTSRLVLGAAAAALAASCAPGSDDDRAGGAGGKADDVGAGAWAGIADVYGVPNLDDDGGDGQDWTNAPAAVDDDRSPLVIPDAVFDGLPDGHSIVLSLRGNTDLVRVWSAGKVILGAGSTEATVAIDRAHAALEVEFGDYRVSATIAIDHVDEDGMRVDGGQVAAVASPLIINHHLQPTEHMWAMAVEDPGYDNTALIEAYTAALGDKFSPVDADRYDYDVWVQDEIEFATATGIGGKRLDIVIDSIRDRGLDDLPEDEMVGPGTISSTWGDHFDRTSYDSFGNLDASPPVVVGGMSYPFGRIYYGRVGTTGLNGELAAFLQQQSVQAPLELDTKWLCVGHVDEFISFVPDPGSAKGFKMLYADVPSAVAILNALPASRRLPKYEFDYGYATVGDMLADDAMIALNQDLQTDKLDPIKQQLMAGLGLTDDDVILVPTLFERVGGCSGRVVALVPGMVNLIVANVPGEPIRLFVPDPFFREVPSNQDNDPFIDAFRAAMPAKLELHFVDNWDVYHLGLGEIHCGTNVRRTPLASWWRGGN